MTMKLAPKFIIGIHTGVVASWLQREYRTSLDERVARCVACTSTVQMLNNAGGDTRQYFDLCKGKLTQEHGHELQVHTVSRSRVERYLQRAEQNMLLAREIAWDKMHSGTKLKTSRIEFKLIWMISNFSVS